MKPTLDITDEFIQERVNYEKLPFGMKSVFSKQMLSKASLADGVFFKQSG